MSIIYFFDSHMAITSGFVHNLGAEYRGSRQLNIMDIQDKVIDGTKVTMGKKIFLQLSISGGKVNYVGLLHVYCLE